MPATTPCALTTPELLALVLRHADNKTQLTACLVCKAWSDVAVELIWEELPSILPLVQLLSPLHVEEDQDSQTRLLEFSDLWSDEQWERFKLYSRKVKSITHDERVKWRTSSKVSPADIALLSISGATFPALHTLKWIAEPDDMNVAQAVPFVRSTLKTLHLHFDLPRGDFHPRLANILQSLAVREDLRLEKLSVTLFSVWHSSSAPSAERSTMALLRRQKFLRSLSLWLDCIPWALDELVPILLRMHSLETLSIGAMVRPWPDLAPLLQLPDLRKFQIRHPLSDCLAVGFTINDVHNIGRAWKRLQYLSLPDHAGGLDILFACAAGVPKLQYLRFQLILSEDPTPPSESVVPFTGLDTLHLGEVERIFQDGGYRSAQLQEYARRIAAAVNTTCRKATRLAKTIDWVDRDWAEEVNRKPDDPVGDGLWYTVLELRGQKTCSSKIEPCGFEFLVSYRPALAPLVRTITSKTSRRVPSHRTQ